MSSDREASSFHTKRYLQKSGKLSKVWNDDSALDTRSEEDFIGSIRQTDAQVRNSFPVEVFTPLKPSHANQGLIGSFRDANGK